VSDRAHLPLVLDFGFGLRMDVFYDGHEWPFNGQMAGAVFRQDLRGCQLSDWDGDRQCIGG
jgi:hypothetical protein